MKHLHDPWYLQLPDGRIVKAKSTASVRHHVEAGNIPLNSMARRDPQEEWIDLARIEDFSDLNAGGNRSMLSMHDTESPAPSANGSSPELNLKTGISARLDPMKLQTVGIRGLVDELIAAFDSTVSTGKPLVACTAAFIGSLGVYLIVRGLFFVWPEGVWLAQIGGTCWGFALVAAVVALLTRQTHLELSKMRPVYPAEARRNVGPFIFRVFLGYIATIGVGIGLLILLQYVPGWLAKGLNSVNPNVSDILQTVAWGLGLVLSVGIFAMMLLSFLVPPILVVEECSVNDAIREWRALIREHRIRVMVYEGLALALAFVAALPLTLPVHLALQYGPPTSHLQPNWAIDAIPLMLRTIAIGPGLAFLAVANLFIYLNLRYEYTPRK